MSKYRPLPIMAETPRAAGNVVPLRSTPAHAAAPIAAFVSAPPRETSWRDLVRRLAKNPAKR